MSASTPAAPKIVQSRLLRTAVVLLLAAGAILAYFVYTNAAKSDTSPAETKDSILAIREGDRRQAVLIKPDGSIQVSPSDTAGAEDREAVWRPDGNRIFISRAVPGSKDVDEKNYQIYRWNPATNSLDRRTIGTRALAHPRFSAMDVTSADAKALATAGGRVLLFDPLKDSSLRQLLPPTTKEAVLDNGEVTDSTTDADMGEAYKGLGTSFKEARWSFDKTYIVAVMGRENGEALIVQKTEPKTDEERSPRLIACGDRIDFDVSGTSNVIAFTVQNFQWPDPAHVPSQFQKGGKISRPFSHGLDCVNLDAVFGDPARAHAAIVRSQVDTNSFAQPAFSPDGTMIAVVGGAFKRGPEFEPQLLLLYAVNGGQPTVLSKGKIANPSWHPAGDRVVFDRRESNGERDILQVGRDGTAEASLTAGKGSFARPLYSPKN